jgi:SAM-dependent methyltransferase
VILADEEQSNIHTEKEKTVEMTATMAAVAAEEMADVGLHEKVMAMLSPLLSSSTRLLIVGAGQGALEHRLDLHGILPNRTCAADIRPDKYRGPQGVQCVACDLNERIPYADGTFDVVVATEVIEHLDNPQRLISEAARVLAPGGRVLITTPNPESIAQRLRFLFTGRLDYFSEGDYQGSGHLHPIFDWLLERWYRDYFTREAYDSYSFHLRIPVLGRLPMPKSMLWAPVNAYVLRKR